MNPSSGSANMSITVHEYRNSTGRGHDEGDKLRLSILVLLAFPICGCVSVSHLSDADNTWVSEKTFQNDRIFYCMANRSDSGIKASPVCIEPTYIERGKVMVRPPSKLDEK